MINLLSLKDHVTQIIVPCQQALVTFLCDRLIVIIINIYEYWWNLGTLMVSANPIKKFVTF